MKSAGLRFPIIIALAAVGVSACSTGSFSIGNYTWADANKNGIQDEGEGPLSNVKVELISADAPETLATTSSDKDGLYIFEELSAGDYRLRFTPPTDYAITQKDAGEDDAVDSDVNNSGNESGLTDVFTIGPDTEAVDAGFFTSAPAPTPTPTPEGVIQSPTGQPITPTPAAASGGAPVDLSVTYDDAGHEIYVALGETTSVDVQLSDGSVELTFASEDGATLITLSGPIDEYGAADLTGTGLVAGFQPVSGTFVGTVETAGDGTVLINGELTLGANSELPQGEPIIYELSS